MVLVEILRDENFSRVFTTPMPTKEREKAKGVGMIRYFSLWLYIVFENITARREIPSFVEYAYGEFHLQREIRVKIEFYSFNFCINVG